MLNRGIKVKCYQFLQLDTYNAVYVSISFFFTMRSHTPFLSLLITTTNYNQQSLLSGFESVL